MLNVSLPESLEIVVPRPGDLYVFLRERFGDIISQRDTRLVRIVSKFGEKEDQDEWWSEVKVGSTALVIAVPRECVDHVLVPRAYCAFSTIDGPVAGWITMYKDLLEKITSHA